MRDEIKIGEPVFVVVEYCEMETRTADDKTTTDSYVTPVGAYVTLENAKAAAEKLACEGDFPWNGDIEKLKDSWVDEETDDGRKSTYISFYYSDEDTGEFDWRYFSIIEKNLG